MAELDYYKVLGILRNASEEDIRSAYRRLVKEHHPDRNPDPNAAARFKKVQEAYEVLSDAEKRARYDRFGHAAFPDSASGPRAWDMGADPFSGIFEDLVGAFGGTVPHRTDIHIGVDLTLEEVATGGEKIVSFSREEPCGGCSGTGGVKEEVCAPCGGRGFVEEATWHGKRIAYISGVPCAACGGRGKRIVEHCGQCRGIGYQTVRKNITVKVPVGVDSGYTIHIKGEGNKRKAGNRTGDLYVEFTVVPHLVFTRENEELLTSVAIPFFHAALGTKVEVPLLGNRKALLTIPAGTQSLTTFVLRGKGLPRFSGMGTGDLSVTVKVKIPTVLTTAQRELLRRYAELSGEIM